MLLALISFSDDQIEVVTSAVREWCHLTRNHIDSVEGRRAITLAVDLVQTRSSIPVLQGLVGSLGAKDHVGAPGE
jgi:hypothetical protein